MEYRCSSALRGEGHAALDLAKSTLMAQGFEILDASSSGLRARGPGMHHTQQPALLGADQIEVRVAGSSIEARATLGGVARMRWFLLLFPPGLALLLLAIFYLVGMRLSWVMLAWLAPWVVISPIWASALRRRTTRAIDAFVRSLASA